MAQYQSIPVYIEAIEWPGWTDSPWPDEFVAFFGRSPFSVIKADNSVSPPRTLLNVSGTWKPLPNGYYVNKPDGSDGPFSMMSPGTFALKYQPRT